MTVGDIISFNDMCAAEGQMLQRGMYFRLRGRHSVLLMSTRPSAPYRDRWEQGGRILVYEGHDAPKRAQIHPKLVDQPAATPKGTPTQNGLFLRAANEYRNGQSGAEIVRVYEKIRDGIWAYNGTFQLIDGWNESDGKRNVFKFRLRMINDEGYGTQEVTAVLPIQRGIPSRIKQEVYKRDHGRCVICGARDNLHFDHDLPFSLGGSSLTTQNVRLLCARHNLEKSDKIQ
jgi:hypothetical protein